MRVGMRVLPKPEVLDKQGRAVQKLLGENGFAVEDCKIGKYYELSIAGDSEDSIRSKVQEMAEFVLYNPLIETYELEVKP